MKNIYSAISLFSGAGGMDIGFERAGINVVMANELMKDAADTYKSNRNTDVMINADIKEILPDFNKYKGIDIVFGGPPCQGFSVAGRMDPNDERSNLIFTFLDVVNIVEPKIFIMENVKALATLDKWKSIRTKYLEKAKDLGYTCYPYILNATEYGVSQKRERVFYIGLKNSYLHNKEQIERLIEAQKNPALTIRDLLKSLGKAGTELNPNTCTAKITFATHPIMRKSPYSGMYFNGQGRPINIDGYSNTLPASMGGNKTPFVDDEYLYGDATENWVESYHRGLLENTIIPEFKLAPSRLRRISINEAKRIQSFPDDYVFCGNKGSIYTQIGNAVPCKLAEVVANAVVSYLEEI